MERLSLPPRDLPCGISYLHQHSVKDTYPAHYHDFYEIFFVVSGKAMHHIAGNAECCFAGTVALLRPDDVHSYTFVNRHDMELISLGILPAVLEEICDFLQIPFAELTAAYRTTVLHLEQAAHMAKRLQRFGEESIPAKRRAMGKSILTELLLELNTPKADLQLVPEWLDVLVAQMRRREYFTEGLPRMLALAPVSQNHLNREMKRCFRMTPTELINSYRVEYAAELLREGKYSVTEVCTMAGFETLSHFYACFQKAFHCAPGEFIRHSRG